MASIKIVALTTTVFSFISEVDCDIDYLGVKRPCLPTGRLVIKKRLCGKIPLLADKAEDSMNKWNEMTIVNYRYFYPV